MVKIPTKTLERNILNQGYDCIIGVDEVGMACLAGPVTVCALAATPEFYANSYPRLARLRDSKMLQSHQREYFASELMRTSGLMWQVASCDSKIIDRVNIYQASRIAMRKAIEGLALKKKAFLLIDGNKKISDIDLPQQAIVKGDQKIWAIAAASIIAKVHRDRAMIDYATQYPDYGFEIHKGYPTAVHRAALARLGPCPLHRRSFRGVIDDGAQQA